MSAGPITLESGGPRVQRLRKAVNSHLGRRHFGWRKVPLGGSPERLIEAVHLVAWMLGFSDQQLHKLMKRREVSRHVELVILGEKARTEAMKKRDRERRDEAKRLRARHRAKAMTLAAVKIHSTRPGRTHWGGSADILGQLVGPVLHGRFGLPFGSGKRTPKHNAEIGGSPTSDHLTSAIYAFARDFPTYAGERAARFLASVFGWHDWQPNSFAWHEFTIGGFRFRIQILWGAAIDHDDHIHVGIEFLGPA